MYERSGLISAHLCAHVTESIIMVLEHLLHDCFFQDLLFSGPNSPFFPPVLCCMEQFQALSVEGDSETLQIQQSSTCGSQPLQRGSKDIFTVTAYQTFCITDIYITIYDNSEIVVIK